MERKSRIKQSRVNSWRFRFRLDRLPFLDCNFDITDFPTMAEPMTKKIRGENTGKQKRTAKLIAAILGDEICSRGDGVAN
jgi:hypothetical protein